MDLGTYIDQLHHQVEVAVEAGGEEARTVGARLLAPLDAAIRLTLQDALTDAAEVITCDLAPGSVEVRVRGRDLDFVVTPPPAEAPATEPAVPDPALAAPSPSDDDDSAMTRINLRLPEHLKTRVERAASASRLSVNAWLVRAATTALERDDATARPDRRAGRSAQHYTGWAR